MAGRVSMTTKGELLAAIGDRYRASGRAERTKILDEFVAVTGYHRKHAIRLLRPEAPFQRVQRQVHRRYGGDVREALVALWEASDQLCSKRLKPIIPVLLPALERHGQLAIVEALRERLPAISPATIDRLLSKVRLVARGGRQRRAGFSSAVRRTVPVRTFDDWNDQPPGLVEVDFVTHLGTTAAGSFVQTRVLTDVATGWTGCVPLVARSGARVIKRYDPPALPAARVLAHAAVENSSKEQLRRLQSVSDPARASRSPPLISNGSRLGCRSPGAKASAVCSIVDPTGERNRRGVLRCSTIYASRSALGYARNPVCQPSRSWSASKRCILIASPISPRRPCSARLSGGAPSKHAGSSPKALSQSAAWRHGRRLKATAARL